MITTNGFDMDLINAADAASAQRKNGVRPARRRFAWQACRAGAMVGKRLPYWVRLAKSAFYLQSEIACCRCINLWL
jgi:hypothetical protein